ncbi:MAG: PQQ-dependent sugar dehydrogenase, partial [Chloroflexota bacterium]
MALLITGLLATLLSPSTAIAQESQEDDIVLGLREVASGFTMPTDIQSPQDGTDRLFVVERTGAIRIIDGGTVREEPFLDLRDKVISGVGETGMFSMVFHPRYAENGEFFVYYTAQPDGANTIERYTVSSDPNRADPNSGETLFAIHDRYDTHNGGGLDFGPDGYLYIGTGDGGGQGDPDGNAQNRQTLLGNILRVDVDSDYKYSIPPDNPYVNDPYALPEIWANGLRNPWRLSFDRETGDLYIGDVGDGAWEEVNFQPAGNPGGQNYGWPLMEGFACFPPQPGGDECDLPGMTEPAFVYDHEAGCSIAGGYVYRGEMAPSARGHYIYGDWCTGNIWAAEQGDDGEWETERLLESGIQITSFGEDANGELYLADMMGGKVHQLVFQRPAASMSITELDPESANAGGPGFTLTVKGERFAENAVIQWNGIDQPTNFISENELQAEISGGLLRTELSEDQARTVMIRVAVPGEDARVSQEIPFSVMAFADDAFQRTWSRTDAPVADEVISRTWMWGPEPVSGPLAEPYAESPDGERLVQYFDKSRMEITVPNGNPWSVWHVTNGLLVLEMMTGEMQTGHDDVELRSPANINVAGDTDDTNGPTYAYLQQHLPAVEPRHGELIEERINRFGTVVEDPSFADEDVRYLYFDDETGHNIAEPFWNFMVSSGLVRENGQDVEDRLFLNPFYATGRPVTEPFWTTITVAGQERDVLVQCFERRCMTYTPDNPEGWRVEAGNVGRHYYDWRYNSDDGTGDEVRQIEVDMTDNQFTPDRIELVAGEPVEFVATSLDTFHT